MCFRNYASRSTRIRVRAACTNSLSVAPSHPSQYQVPTWNMEHMETSGRIIHSNAKTNVNTERETFCAGGMRKVVPILDPPCSMDHVPNVFQCASLSSPTLTLPLSPPLVLPHSFFPFPSAMYRSVPSSPVSFYTHPSRYLSSLSIFCINY